MDADLDTLATALYVHTDDAVKADPGLAPARPAVGFAPRITDAELVTLAVMQALLGFTSEAKFLRRGQVGGRSGSGGPVGQRDPSSSSESVVPASSKTGRRRSRGGRG